MTKEIWLNLPVKDVNKSKQHDITDTSKSSEILLSIESRDEVDIIAKLAKLAE